MINELKNAELIKKMGGRFKLTVLIQKRLAELLHGSRPLIDDPEGKTNLEIVIEEIKEDKIAFEDENSQQDKEGDKRETF